MGIDSMRVGGGRCPPLLVGGLLVACLMLICNWWTLSSENIGLVQQIDDLNEQLKISAEERDQCVTLRRNLEQRYKHSEDEVASLHVRLEQQNELKKKNDELKDSIAMYKTELDSLKKLDTTKTATLETLRLEKNTINVQLGAKKEENKKLQEEVNELKDQLAKAKLACNTVPEKKSTLIQEPETSPKEQKNETQNESADKDNPGIGDVGNADESNPDAGPADENLTEEAEREQESKTTRTTEKAKKHAK